MPFESISWFSVSIAKWKRVQTEPMTHLPDLLGLCIPLGAVLVVLDRAELTQQQEDLGNDDAREVL